MSTKHGHRYDPEYQVYRGIIARCENPNNSKYKNYGGKGIKVCRRWRKSYVNFIEDMGPRPKQSKPREYSIERINRKKGYSPSNCKWATYAEQSVNRDTNVFIKYKGRKQTISQWAIEKGINYSTLLNRLRNGWDKSKLFNAPYSHHN